MTAHINGRERAMTRHRTTLRVLLALGVSACAMTATASAQEPPVLREAPGVEDVRQLLIASYPELREGRVNWRVTTTAAGLLVEAHRVETPFAPLPDATAALVTGTAVVDQEGQLESLLAGGTVLEAVRMKAATLAARRPRDVDQALKGARAKFAPSDDEKAATLVPPGVQAVLKTSKTRGQTFRADPPPDKVKEGLTWELEVEGAAVGAAAFTLVFEPLEGRLMSVVRR
jgi:hypothetical protein